MTLTNARQAGPRLLQALGLPTERCMRVTITMEPGDIVRVIPEYAATEAQMDQVQEALVEMAADQKAAG